MKTHDFWLVICEKCDKDTFVLHKPFMDDDLHIVCKNCGFAFIVQWPSDHLPLAPG